MGYVIDSNVVIDYLSGELPTDAMLFMHGVVNDTPVISIMTHIEVLGFNNPSDIEDFLNQFIDYSLVVPLNDDIVKRPLK